MHRKGRALPGLFRFASAISTLSPDPLLQIRRATAANTIVTFRQQFMNNPRAKRLAEGTAHFPP
jgi:hypothetical protein